MRKMLHLTQVYPLYLNDKKLSEIERVVMVEKALTLSHRVMAESLLLGLSAIKLEYIAL